MKNKDFDCVEMKNKIQEKLLKKRKEFSSDKKYHEAIKKKLESDPKWKDFIRQLKSSNNKAA